uniref:Uncharacterized protein n=1 Tax=Panagrolaimus davidi TaxID=227884 RepID=A0A914NYM6_9BILA
MDLRPKQLHFRGPYRRQNWSLSYLIIGYITKNPSNAKAWEKLIQSCKYFFAKNPIIVADYLNFSQGWEISSNTSTGRLQKLLNLYCSRVENGNGTVETNEERTIVPLEKLVKTLVNLKEISGEIDPSHSCITKGTVKELLLIPHFSKIYGFFFAGLPEVFDIDTFFIYLKKNKYTKFELHFAASISEEYKARLEKIVDEILQTETHDYNPPWISFDGLAQEKYHKMGRRYGFFPGLSM